MDDGRRRACGCKWRGKTGFQHFDSDSPAYQGCRPGTPETPPPRPHHSIINHHLSIKAPPLRPSTQAFNISAEHPGTLRHHSHTPHMIQSSIVHRPIRINQPINQSINQSIIPPCVPARRPSTSWQSTQRRRPPSSCPASARPWRAASRAPTPSESWLAPPPSEPPLVACPLELE